MSSPRTLDDSSSDAASSSSASSSPSISSPLMSCPLSEQVAAAPPSSSSTSSPTRKLPPLPIPSHTSSAVISTPPLSPLPPISPRSTSLSMSMSMSSPRAMSPRSMSPLGGVPSPRALAASSPRAIPPRIRSMSSPRSQSSPLLSPRSPPLSPLPPPSPPLSPLPPNRAPPPTPTQIAIPTPTTARQTSPPTTPRHTSTPPTSAPTTPRLSSAPALAPLPPTPTPTPPPGLSQRDKVANEIVESEQSYVNNLETIALFYRIPLEANALMHAEAVSADDLKSLFSQIDVLQAYHRRLLEQLLECQRQWNEASTLGGVFLEIVQFLRLYSNYVNQYPRSQEVLKRMYQSPSSGKLLRQLDEQPEVRGLSLKDYLIMPVQRIPRYILLVHALMKATSPGHADLVELQQAKEKLEEVAEMLEVSQRVSRNGQALMRIQASLCPRNAAELRLIQPDRWFLREGKLLARSSATSTRTKQRNVYLFSDLLLITKSRKQKQDEEVTHILMLTDIASVRSSGADDSAIAISHKGSDLWLSCEALADTKAWLTDLVLHFTKAKAKMQQSAFKSPTLSPATSPRRPHKSVSIGAPNAVPSRLLQEASVALGSSSPDIPTKSPSFSSLPSSSSSSSAASSASSSSSSLSSLKSPPTLKRTLSVKSRQEMLGVRTERDHSSLIIFSSLPTPSQGCPTAVSAPTSPVSSPGRVAVSPNSARQLSRTTSELYPPVPVPPPRSAPAPPPRSAPIERASSAMPQPTRRDELQSSSSFSNFARLNLQGTQLERLRAELATITPRADSPPLTPSIIIKRPSTPNLDGPKFGASIEPDNGLGGSD